MSEPRYRVIEHIDAGGMAEVFKASASSVKGFDKLVAIKRILPNLTKNERFVRMFLDEAKVSLILNHANCVQVFDLVFAEGTYLIIMEFVDGVNLKHIIEEVGIIPIQSAVYIAVEICKGLAHAHNKVDREGRTLGIVHRDVSPANIMVSAEGEVKVTDFGLAKARNQVEKTDPGVVKGKFGYLSPESAYGKEVDKRTDLFAVGILLWEMLTGKRLFLGETDLETLQQVRTNRVAPPSTLRHGVPQALDQLLRRALASDPNHRFQSAEEMIVELTKFLFAYGHPVSCIDIIDLVRQQKEKRKPAAKTTEDQVLAQELQEAVDRLVSLDKILKEGEDLDRYMAQMYGSMESTEKSQAGPGSGEVNFEDPSIWADLGIDASDMAFRSREVDRGGNDRKEEEGELEAERDLRQRALVSEDRESPSEVAREVQVAQTNRPSAYADSQERLQFTPREERYPVKEVRSSAIEEYTPRARQVEGKKEKENSKGRLVIALFLVVIVLLIVGVGVVLLLK